MYYLIVFVIPISFIIRLIMENIHKKDILIVKYTCFLMSMIFIVMIFMVFNAFPIETGCILGKLICFFSFLPILNCLSKIWTKEIKKFLEE